VRIFPDACVISFLAGDIIAKNIASMLLKNVLNFSDADRRPAACQTLQKLSARSAADHFDCGHVSAKIARTVALRRIFLHAGLIF